jgi:2-hydroxy-6-oxonona-2,4-dienedioate hydrolase
MTTRFALSSSSRQRVAVVAVAAFLAMLPPAPVMAQGATPAPDGSVGGQRAQFITIDGGRTRYYEAGTGPDVVLLIHGARPGGTSSANTWTPIIAGLAQRYRVLAPDRLGHGMSENPRDSYTATAEMEHIYAFLKAKNVTRLHVIGQSTGAWHAARLALQKPEMVRALIIVDSATLSPPVGNLAERRAAIGLGQGAGAQRSGTIEEGFRFNMEALSRNKEHVTEEFVAAAGFMARQPAGMKTDAAMKGEEAKRYEANIQAGAREMREWIAEGRLQAPTLLYWGRNDPSAIVEIGLKLFDMIAEKNRRASMLIANDRGHFHYRERPDEFVHTVTAFMGQY